MSLGVLFAAEVALRAFAPIHLASILEAYEYDAELGVRLRPNVHLFKTTDHQQELRTNKLGSVNFQDDFDGYLRRVFALGDSYTMGMGLPSDLSYPSQLDLLINRDQTGFYRKQYAIVNLGLAAYGGEQNLIALRLFAARLGRPDAILYLGCDNDAADDELFLSGYRHGHLVSGNPRWGPMVGVLQWLSDELQLGIRVKLLSGHARRGAILAQRAADGRSVAEAEEAVFERLASYATSEGVELVVGWADIGASYDWLRAWASRHDVRFADWLPKVNAVTKAIPALPLENVHSGGHYRGWVNRIIAEEFEKQLRSALPASRAQVGLTD